MAKTKGFVVVMAISAVWECILLWLLVHPGSVARLGNNKLFPFLLMPFALAPVYPLYRLAKRWPRLKWGILSLELSVFLSVAFAFLYYVFRMDNSWVQGMFDLSQVLFIVSSLLLVWQAATRHG